MAPPRTGLGRRYAEAVVRHRRAIVLLTAVATVFLGDQIRHLRVVVNPETLLPQSHPLIVTTNRIVALFESKYVSTIGLMPVEGDVLQPAILDKVGRITKRLLDSPGVIAKSVLSLTALRAKTIEGTADGIEVRPLVEHLPRTPADRAALQAALERNPLYLDTLISRDYRTTAILVEFREDDPQGFRGVMSKIEAAVAPERDQSVRIALGGMPILIAYLEYYSGWILVLFPLAVTVVGIIHYDAFRTLQGLIVPLVTALLAVVWSTGLMGLAGVQMDTLNVSTPILILAIAAGHSVQILKRYYEEYDGMRARGLQPVAASHAAVVESLVRIGPVMCAAAGVAAAGFLSLVVFDLKTVRTFGAFAGLGALSTLVLEMSFIPALRSLLPAPPAQKSGGEDRRLWARLTEAIGDWVTDGRRRARLYAAVAFAVVLFCVGANRLMVDNRLRDEFFHDLAFQRDDRFLNDRLAGTDTLFLLIEGDAPDTIKRPEVLRAMEATQGFLAAQPFVGKTVSLVDCIKRMNRAMHDEDARYEVVPAGRRLIAQYLLLYEMSGGEGDLDRYVDAGYQNASVWIFLKTDSSAYFEELQRKVHAFVPTVFPPDVRVRLGGTVATAAALNDVTVRGKFLNILQVAAVIVVVSSLVFRSILAGLLVLVPLLLAVLANFGLMGLFGINLNTTTSIIAAIAVGIGADYSIYLLYRIREELAREPDERAAIRQALATAGRAVLFVASAVAGGYAVLVLSYGFWSYVKAGVLIATSMVVSALGALTVLPSLALSLRPRFLFKSGSDVPAKSPDERVLVSEREAQ